MDSLIPDLKTLVRFALSDLLFDIRRTMPLVAHHGAELDYDKQKPVSGTGVVSKMEWTNPHRRVYVDVTDEKGLVTTWNLELGSPNSVYRRGSGDGQWRHVRRKSRSSRFADLGEHGRGSKPQTQPDACLPAAYLHLVS